MAVKGVFASDSNIVGSRKGDFASALLQTEPTGSAPLLALSSGMMSSGAGDTVVTWFEENNLSGRVNIVNNAGTGTSLTVDDASQVVPGMIFMAEASGEYMYVTAVSGTTVTVVRGFGDTNAGAIDGSSSAKPIQRIGTAFEEGSDKPVAYANLGFPRFNYMQIFRNTWDVTGTARSIDYYTGDPVAKNKRDAALFHAEDIERSFWWGKKSIGSKNGKPFHTMDGVISQISTNVETGAGGVSTDDLRDFLQAVFERNVKGKPNERIAFCGNTVLAVLDKLATEKGVINITPGQTEFGLKVNKWMSPFGDISLMTHPLMNQSPLWTKDLYVLHPGALEIRYLRKTFYDDNDVAGSRNGRDADFGVMTTECTIQYKAERTGGVYTGIDTAVTGAST